jgi:hypothetical protein
MALYDGAICEGGIFNELTRWQKDCNKEFPWRHSQETTPQTFLPFHLTRVSSD